MEVVDEVLLPILGGRALARLKCTCKTFSDQIHNDHVAWLGGVSNPPAGPNARARFLDRLSDTCSSCGAETDITKALSYSRQYFCSSCMFRHANRVRDLGNFDRALAMRVMQLNIAIRRRELDPIFAGATKACAEFQGRPMAPARLLFSTRYDGQALCMFFGLTAGKQNTLLIMDTTCGHYLGAFVPEAWKNFGDKVARLYCAFACRSGVLTQRVPLPGVWLEADQPLLLVPPTKLLSSVQVPCLTLLP